MFGYVKLVICLIPFAVAAVAFIPYLAKRFIRK